MHRTIEVWVHSFLNSRIFGHGHKHIGSAAGKGNDNTILISSRYLFPSSPILYSYLNCYCAFSCCLAKSNVILWLIANFDYTSRSHIKALRSTNLRLLLSPVSMGTPYSNDNARGIMTAPSDDCRSYHHCCCVDIFRRKGKVFLSDELLVSCLTR